PLRHAAFPRLAGGRGVPAAAGPAMVSPTAIGALVLGCTFGSALLGMRLRRFVPDEHVGAAAWDTAKLGTGLVATMTALLLGLVTASAKSSFDEVGATIRHTAAVLLALDRTLVKYGPETEELRRDVQQGVARRVELTWQDDGARGVELAVAE